MSSIYQDSKQNNIAKPIILKTDELGESGSSYETRMNWLCYNLEPSAVEIDSKLPSEDPMKSQTRFSTSNDSRDIKKNRIPFIKKVVIPVQPNRTIPFQLKIQNMFSMTKWCFVALIILLSCELGESVIVVDAGINGTLSLPTQTAVLACAGFQNRETPAVYSLHSQDDITWWELLYQSPASPNVDVVTFLRQCLSSFGYVRYDYDSQRTLFPIIITVSSVLDGVPLQDELLHELFPSGNYPPLVFDAVNAWENTTVESATDEIYRKYIMNTTGLAMMDPGYEKQTLLEPPVIGKDPLVGLVDFIIRRKLFNMFLWDACIPLTRSHEIMTKIANNNPWHKPIGVFGYNDFTLGETGGDPFEAETNCLRAHNMGQIASEGCSNLSYLSAKGNITEPMTQNPVGAYDFDAQETYISFVVGDGDNLNYLKGTRLQWMKQRVSECAPARDCYPLLWSFSPQTLSVAPDWTNTYFSLAATTKRDYFVLPPSGSLYAYPAMMPDDVQASFVADTENECKLLNTSMSVEWEWFFDWEKAINDYLPRYTENGVVTGFVPVNVPYMFPILSFGRDEYYKIITGNSSHSVVLFRPREWRGTTGANHFMLTPQQMADEVNAYPLGTVTAIYLTSDGGATLDAFNQLSALLQPSVKIVDFQFLTRAAIQHDMNK